MIRPGTFLNQVDPQDPRIVAFRFWFDGVEGTGPHLIGEDRGSAWRTANMVWNDDGVTLEPKHPFKRMNMALLDAEGKTLEMVPVGEEELLLSWARLSRNPVFWGLVGIGAYEAFKNIRRGAR